MTQPWTHSSPNAQGYPRSDEDWYCDPAWCSARLFEEEAFEGGVYDPCCGMGTIVINAIKAGLRGYGSDLVNRGWDSTPQDFLKHKSMHDNIVCNPPFDLAVQFAMYAQALARHKVAMIFPTARLNAASWLEKTPLARVWLMTPRPSMLPGSRVMAGEKAGGGKSDYCWIVMQHSYRGQPELRWLQRDKL